MDKYVKIQIGRQIYTRQINEKYSFVQGITIKSLASQIYRQINRQIGMQIDARQIDARQIDARQRDARQIVARQIDAR